MFPGARALGFVISGQVFAFTEQVCLSAAGKGWEGGSVLPC